MDIEKMVEIELLYSQYASLLTSKQREIISMYYEEDYSLGEISQLLNISRQSVYDSLKRSENTLKDYEKKLEMVKSSQKLEKIVIEFEKEIEDLSTNFNCGSHDKINKLQVILEQMRELI